LTFFKISFDYGFCSGYLLELIELISETCEKKPTTHFGPAGISQGISPPESLGKAFFSITRA